MTSFGLPVSGILYIQGGRRFISTGLPTKILLSLARHQSASKKEDPTTTRNRPLDQGHVREIAEYLRGQPEYLLPPIILNAAQPLQTFVYRSSAATRPCVIVLPPEEYLYVTDGQHRLEALRQAITQKPELEHDSVGVTIIEEANIDKVHQDFFDAAQVKPLAKALLVEYDGREPLNWLAREVSNSVRVFKDRVERLGNVGKNSLILFTTNQVKQGVLQLVVGDWSLYGDMMHKQAEQAVGPAKDLWKERLINFFNEFTQENDQWHEVAERPLASGLSTDVPGMREKYLHFTGAGLLVLCGVGHTILEFKGSPNGRLTTEQKDLVRRLASLDWSRRASLWQGYLIGPQGNVTTQKNHIILAVAKAKKALGLPITAKEVGALQRAEEEQPAAS
jgi:DNA sulfur modification protein DndB